MADRPIPSLLRFGVPVDSYVVCDPVEVGKWDKVAPDGSVQIDLGQNVSYWFCVALGAVVGILGAAANDTANPLVFGFWWFVGTLVSIFVVIPAEFVACAIYDLRRRKRSVVSAKVCPGDTAFHICEIVDSIVSTQAWVDRSVDTHRQVPALLWMAVLRSSELDAQESDVLRAKAHPSLAELAAQNAESIAGERASVEAVQSNLFAIMESCELIDQRARDADDDERRRDEEAGLRGRLAANLDPLAMEMASDYADRASGLAAEVEAIAGWIEESSRILRSA